MMTRKRQRLPTETVSETAHDVGPTLLHGDFDDESTAPPRPKQVPSASFVRIETNTRVPDPLFEEEEPESLPEEPTEVKHVTSEDIREDVKDKALKALKVLAFDPKISSWLHANVPRAYKQVCDALGMAPPRSPSMVCPYCGRSAVVDLQDGSEILSSECLAGNCAR